MDNWTLEAHQASLRWEDDSTTNSLRIAVDHPERGIEGLTQEGGALLQLVKPALNGRLRDAFIRGDDLVADYGAAEDQPCDLRLYWRCTSEDRLLQVDFSLVVRTPAWTCQPNLVLHNHAPGMERLGVPDDVVDALTATLPDQAVCPQVTPSVVAMGNSDAPRLALIIFPSDLHSIETKTDRIELCLLGEPLEKGVIRTARVRLLSGPALNWQQICAAWETLLDAPLPLTP